MPACLLARAEDAAWDAIQSGELGDFYEGVDDQGRRFVVDSETNVGYETLDPMGKPAPDLLDGYVVTADGEMFYEQYDESKDGGSIDRTRIGVCKRTLKSAGTTNRLPLYDIQCDVETPGGREVFKSNMNDIRKINGPTFPAEQAEAQ